MKQKTYFWVEFWSVATLARDKEVTPCHPTCMWCLSQSGILQAHVQAYSFTLHSRDKVHCVHSVLYIPPPTSRPWRSRWKSRLSRTCCWGWLAWWGGRSDQSGLRAASPEVVPNSSFFFMKRHVFEWSVCKYCMVSCLLLWATAQNYDLHCEASDWANFWSVLSEMHGEHLNKYSILAWDCPYDMWYTVHVEI
jgi:hypothetical protein